ncbi:MAG: hypothetical protein R3C14_37340 [Caldilineaceae bacterium]
MVRMNPLISIFVLVTLLFSACQPIQLVAPDAQSAPVASTTGPTLQPHVPRFDAPPFGQRGPYAVGVRDLVIAPATEGERAIGVTVWYPALNPDNQPEYTAYMLDFKNPNFADFAIGGAALRDAEPDTQSGPYPLVIYSHGLTLFRQISSYLTEHLASWGFVVIAGDHQDNWGTLNGESYRQDFVIRPQEVSREIDFAATLTAADGALAGLIDLDHVAVTGHSFGAETALLIGGARLNTNLFLNEWCTKKPADGLNDCGAVPTLLDQMVTLAGLQEVPADLWPDWSDPRVDAIIALAPGAQFYGAEGLATLHVPTLLVEGGLDWYASGATANYAPYTLMPANLKTHLVFKEADHGIYLNGCATMPGLLAQGMAFCADAVWDVDRAHDLLDHVAAAFLLAELKGDTEAAKALAPENVTFPGIQYETTAYGK